MAILIWYPSGWMCANSREQNSLFVFLLWRKWAWVLTNLTFIWTHNPLTKQRRRFGHKRGNTYENERKIGLRVGVIVFVDSSNGMNRKILKGKAKNDKKNFFTRLNFIWRSFFWERISRSEKWRHFFWWCSIDSYNFFWHLIKFWITKSNKILLTTERG